MSTQISTEDAYELLRRFQGRTHTEHDAHGNAVVTFQEGMIRYTLVYNWHGLVTLSTNNMVA